MAETLHLSDWFVRWYQPYVTLAEGNATAYHSLLLDYVSNHIGHYIIRTYRYVALDRPKVSHQLCAAHTCVLAALDVLTVRAHRSKLFAAVVSYKQRHWLVFVSSVIALVTILLQPLAGSMLQIQSLTSSAGQFYHFILTTSVLTAM